MKEALIKFKTAKLAKEKGFRSCETNYIYVKGKEDKRPKLLPAPSDHYNDSPLPCYGCYTQGLIQKWLREVHQIHVWVYPWTHNEYVLDLVVYVDGEEKDSFLENNNYTNYEDALEYGLQQALKIIK